MKKYCFITSLFLSAVLYSTAITYVLPCVVLYSRWGYTTASIGMGILGFLLLAAAFFAFIFYAENRLWPDVKPKLSAMFRHVGRLALTSLLLLPIALCISLACGVLAYILGSVLMPVALKTVVDSIAGILWLLFLPIFLYGGLRTLADLQQPLTLRSLCGILPAKRIYVRLLLWVSIVCISQVVIHTVCSVALSSVATARLLQLVTSAVLETAFAWRLLTIYQAEKVRRMTAVVL